MSTSRVSLGCLRCVTALALLVLLSRFEELHGQDSGTLTPEMAALRHEAMVQAAQLVDLDAETCMSDSTVPFQKWRSTWDATRRRYRMHMPNAQGDGLFFDQLFEGGKVKQLKGRDPDKSVNIELGSPDRMVGVISEEAEAVFADKAQCYMMHRFRLLLNDKDQSLLQLLRTAPAPATCEATVLGMRPVYKLAIPVVGMTDSKTGILSYQGSKLIVFLDPARNFAACRVDCEIAPDAGLKSPAATQRIESIGDWQEFDGAWFPLKTRIIVEMSGKEASKHVVFSVSIRSVNRPLPRDAFDFEFPENLLVGEVDASGKSRDAVHLIGSNGEIGRTFASRSELDEFGKKLGIGIRSPGGRWPTLAIWSAIIGVVGIVAFVLWKRFRR